MRSVRSRGYTLIEVIIVVGLVGVMALVVAPNFNMIIGTEESVKIGRLIADVRSAYDLSVLRGRTHRLVFHLASGDYWLEESDRRRVFLGDHKIDRELTTDEMKEALEIFEEEFEEYENLAGEEVKDPETDKMIKPTSPVVQAKGDLSPAQWQVVDTQEWQGRTVGPYMLFQEIQSEHHAERQKLEILEDRGIATIYFFPNGYVQQAVLKIANRIGEFGVDPDVEPYLLVTNSYEGTAHMIDSEDEFQFNEREEP